MLRVPGQTKRRIGPRVDDARLLILATVLGICALAALACTIGADARWLAAVGQVIESTRQIPGAVPYAAAPSAHWADATALGQLIFHWLEAGLGDRGLMIAQLMAVGTGLTLLARDAFEGGARATGVAFALVLSAIGTLPSLAVARAQLFSIALFPAMVALLRSEARTPSRRIGLCVPLLVLWSNLHGAALTGLGVAGIYLVLARLRQDPWTAIGVGLCSLVAVCVTPVGLRTITYYRGVLTNVAAQRGEGLWSSLSLSAPFDVVLIAVGLLLIVMALRGWRWRPPLWELASVFAFVLLTVQTSRSGVWLLFLLVGPAARGFSVRLERRSVSITVAGVASAALILGITRGPLSGGATQALLARAISIAHGTPVLAPDVIAERIALAGGRVWLANPIDAFSKADQGTYLDWLDGRDEGRRALADHVNVVLVDEASAADKLMARTAGFTEMQAERRVRLYVRAG